MKEFIEKLIGRFRDCTTIEDYGELFVSLDEVENIIYEFAEEYINTSTNTSTNKSSGWISVAEKLPESNGWYLVTNVLGVVQQQYWGASHWQKLRDEAVIAWMPLPEPYIEQQKELSTNMATTNNEQI